MENFVILDGKKIVLSDQMVEELKKKLKIRSSCKPSAELAGYVIHGDGTAIKLAYVKGCLGSQYWAHGNWRVTEAGAKKNVKYRRAAQRIWEWREENYAQDTRTPGAYFIYYNVRFRKFAVSRNGSANLGSAGSAAGGFPTEALATACVIACYKDLLIVWNLK